MNRELASPTVPLTAWAEALLDDLKARGLERHLVPVGSDTSPLDFTNNDYLDLRTHRALQRAAGPDRDPYCGAGASRLLSGTHAIHLKAERALAELFGTEASLLFSSGYSANVSVLSALIGREDRVHSDALNHASLIDGIRLSGASVSIYPHLDMTTLEKNLAAQAPGTRRQWIVTDALFSMDGDFAPLVHMDNLARKYGAALYVDESHSAGILGDRGAGLCHLRGITPDVIMCGLGKAFGSLGGAVLAAGPIVRLLVHRARGFVYSTAVPPVLAEVAHEACSLVAGAKEQRNHLRRNIEYLNAQLTELGLANDTATKQLLPSPIFTVGTRGPRACTRAAQALREHGVTVAAIREPTVPPGGDRLRMSVRADHRRSDLDTLADALHTHQHLLFTASP